MIYTVKYICMYVCIYDMYIYIYINGYNIPIIMVYPLVNMQKTIDNHEFEYLHGLFSMWYSECHKPPAGLFATLWSVRDSPAFVLP